MSKTENEISCPDYVPPSEYLWIKIVAVGFSLFQLYTAGFGALPNIIQRSIHLGFVFLLCFALYRIKKNSKAKIPHLDWIIILVIVAVTIYTVVNYTRIITSMGTSTIIDRIVALIWLLLIAEAARRLMGWFFPCLLAVFVVYPFIPNLPGVFFHDGFSFKLIMEQLYMGTVGFWGVVTATSATTIAIYIIFGAMLLGTGAGQTFMDVAQIVSGRTTGGAAKVSVIASGFFGTINGTITANVATTGSFTIPTMKRLGYQPEMAGAVEATASTGGQIMPPIMGAGAFIMAEIIGMRYASIAAAAAIPAILYYVACFTEVHYESKRRGYLGISKDQLPKIRSILTPKKSLPLIIPVALLLYMLLIGYTPVASAFWSIAAMLVMQAVFLRSTQDLIEFGRKVIQSLQEGGTGIILVGALVAVSQVISSIAGLTGLGIRFSEAIMSISGGQLFLSLVLAMIIVLILGMGVPTVAAYVLGAAVVGPALTTVGIEPLPAHLFIFYFAAISAITPPVCGGVYVAAAIAKSDWFKTALAAMRLGIAGFLVPYVLIYKPALILEGTLFEIIWTSLLTLLAVYFLSIAIIGYTEHPLSPVKRGFLFAGSFLAIWPTSYLIDILGLVIFVIFILSEALLNRQTAKTLSHGT